MAKVEGFADNVTFQRGITRVPFSPTTVRRLMVLQTRHDIHPYTCGNRGDGKHEKIGGQTGILIPTVSGWVCPDCDYTQDWVHNSFLNAIIFDVAFDKPSHAPASTAPEDVVEKYADEIWSMVDYGDDPVKTTLESILTRFKAEITVDAERQKLVDELVAAAIAWEQIEPPCGCGGECHFDRLHNAIKAIKSAGGGK